LITCFEIGKSANQFAVCIRRHRDVVESNDAVDVEKIDEFAEDFEFETLAKIKKASRALRISRLWSKA
jgi:hypothetical protein